MKKFKANCLLLTACYLLSGCDHDYLFQRTGTNYFPLAQGNTWTYLSTHPNKLKELQDTVTLKVVDTKPFHQRSAWVIERNGFPEYWWKSTQRIDKFYCETIFVNGEEDTIIACWIPWLHLPFILNERKSYSFEEEKYILKDTILTTIQIDYEVIAFKSNDYLIEITLIKNRKSENFGTYRETTIYSEWHRQDVGMIKRSVNDIQEKLISYSLH